MKVSLPFAIDRTSALSLTVRWGIPARIAASGIPFVCLGSVSKTEFPSLVGCIDLDFAPALGDFAAHCRAAGIRRVMWVSQPDVSYLDCRAAVEAAITGRRRSSTTSVMRRMPTCRCAAAVCR